MAYYHAYLENQQVVIYTAQLPLEFQVQLGRPAGIAFVEDDNEDLLPGNNPLQLDPLIQQEVNLGNMAVDVGIALAAVALADAGIATGGDDNVLANAPQDHAAGVNPVDGDLPALGINLVHHDPELPQALNQMQAGVGLAFPNANVPGPLPEHGPAIELFPVDGNLAAGGASLLVRIRIPENGFPAFILIHDEEEEM